MGRVPEIAVVLLVVAAGCYAGVDPDDSAMGADTEVASTDEATASIGDSASSGPAQTTTTTTSGATGNGTTAPGGSAEDGTLDDGEDPTTDTGDENDDADVDPPPEGCSAAGVEIVNLINGIRAEHDLHPIPLAPSMCIVAATHNQDLVAHAPHAPAECNLHSWSDQGPWTGCCYTSDHAQAQCMWDKPKELTTYTANGFEVSAGGGGGLTPQVAVDLWMNSAGHRAVLLSEGPWADPPWAALGADLQGGYAHAWFGREPDPAAP